MTLTTIFQLAAAYFSVTCVNHLEVSETTHQTDQIKIFSGKDLWKDLAANGTYTLRLHAQCLLTEKNANSATLQATISVATHLHNKNHFDGLV